LAPASLVELGRMISQTYCLFLIVLSILFNYPAHTFDPMVKDDHQCRWFKKSEIP
jgi:hypothetical protein